MRRIKYKSEQSLIQTLDNMNNFDNTVEKNDPSRFYA
jgi:hypothetical protein